MLAVLSASAVLLAALAPSAAFAKDGQIKKPSGSAKSLEFDDVTIEGMNKRPGDYASTVKKRNDHTGHLYNKRISFEKDLDETLREMRYAQ
jgi:hypothetical protein